MGLSRGSVEEGLSKLQSIPRYPAWLSFQLLGDLSPLWLRSGLRDEVGRWEKKKKLTISPNGMLCRKHHQVILAGSLNPVAGTVHETGRGKCRWRSSLRCSNNRGNMVAREGRVKPRKCGSYGRG